MTKESDNESEKKYPISEFFISIQGEGVFQGTVMQFIRLAGCTVGKPYPKEKYKSRMDPIEGAHEIPGLPIYTEQCTLWDGVRTFPCDTDYRVKERLTVSEILGRIPLAVEHVCITGGEPLMHDVEPLIKALANLNKYIHVETSGTIDIPQFIADNPNEHEMKPGYVWFTVSPKKNVLQSMLDNADEIKLLVDENFKNEDRWEVLARSKPVYLQPINGEHTINSSNLRLCRDLQIKYPYYRLSMQGHKVMEMILKERVL